MTGAFSWENSVILCPASFCIPRPNLCVTSYFCIPSPYNEKGIFWGVLILESLVDIHKTIKLQHFWLVHRLGYCDIEWFAWK